MCTMVGEHGNYSASEIHEITLYSFGTLGLATSVKSPVLIMSKGYFGDPDFLFSLP